MFSERFSPNAVRDAVGSPPRSIGVQPKSRPLGIPGSFRPARTTDTRINLDSVDLQCGWQHWQRSVPPKLKAKLPYIRSDRSKRSSERIGSAQAGQGHRQNEVAKIRSAAMPRDPLTAPSRTTDRRDAVPAGVWMVDPARILP
eukprot:gene57719-79081_t